MPKKNNPAKIGRETTNFRCKRTREVARHCESTGDGTTDSRPGTPTDNPHIESFSGSFRDECLNMNTFLSLDDARDKTERWRKDCWNPSAQRYFSPDAG